LLRNIGNEVKLASRGHLVGDGNSNSCDISALHLNRFKLGVNLANRLSLNIASQLSARELEASVSVLGRVLDELAASFSVSALRLGAVRLGRALNLAARIHGASVSHLRSILNVLAAILGLLAFDLLASGLVVRSHLPHAVWSCSLSLTSFFSLSNLSIAEGLPLVFTNLGNTLSRSRLVIGSGLPRAVGSSSLGSASFFGLSNWSITEGFPLIFTSLRNTFTVSSGRSGLG